MFHKCAGITVIKEVKSKKAINVFASSRSRPDQELTVGDLRSEGVMFGPKILLLGRAAGCARPKVMVNTMGRIIRPGPAGRGGQIPSEVIRINRKVEEILMQLGFSTSKE